MHKQATVLQSIHRHVEQRVDELYPSDIYSNTDGAIPPELQDMVQARAKAEDNAKSPISSNIAFELKPSTMPDAPDDAWNVFTYARPTLVLSEASTTDALDKNTVVENALGSINNMTVEMSNVFENQFVSKYMARIFPWALNFDCGGADYPDLFTRYDEDDPESKATAVRNTWRRIANEAKVTPEIYKQMLATRPENKFQEIGS